MMDNYEQAVDYLLSFADFERSGRFQHRPDLAPVRMLLARLGNPHLGRVTVHVAGSKGKGSVCAMVESVLRAAGLRTGLYTSPHLHDYTERVRIKGEPVPAAEFTRLTGRLKDAVDVVALSLGERRLVTFDLLTALAFMAFRQAGVDAQVIEVGLGGRLDSTNVFEQKETAVITPISLEHTAILGETVEQIAVEKAGIITQGCTVVLAAQEYDAANAVVHRVAEERGATVVSVTDEYKWNVKDHDLRGQAVAVSGPAGRIEAHLSLVGQAQAANAASAVAAVDVLRPAFPALDDRAVERGLASARWPGRFEVVHESPLVIVDGAHNADSARTFVETLRDYCGARKAVLIVAASDDKDIGGMAGELAPVAERVIATRTRHPRAMDPGRIRQEFEVLSVAAENVDTVSDAIERAMEASGEAGLICLVGSLFIAAEGREYFGLS
jgi:dihydrofolate synthase/folylpolyglutamate synthase